MAEIELHRGFRLYGTEITDFLDAVTNMERATRSEIINTEQLSLAAVVDSEKDAQDIAITTNSHESLAECANAIFSTIQKRKEKDELALYHCQASGKFALKALQLESLREKPGMTDALIDELTHGSKMIISIKKADPTVSPKSNLQKNITCIVSDLAFSTLNNRAKLGGDAMNHPSVGRVVECAKAFFLHSPQNMQMIIRSNHDAHIIVAAHSEKYCYVPQTVLCEIYHKIARDLGNPVCLYWEVTHEISHCYIGFPDIAEDFAKLYGLPATITPGLYLSTSDSGDGSLTIRGIWNINDHTVGGEVIKRNHRGEVDVDEFVDNAWKTIHAKYNSIPERLAELLTIDIEDPKETLKSVFKQIEMAKASNMGRNASTLLLNELCNEFSPSGKYTAYDLAMAITSAPDRCVGLHHSVVEKMQNIVHKAIFADYTKKSSKKGKEAITFALT